MAERVNVGKQRRYGLGVCDAGQAFAQVGLGHAVHGTRLAQRFADAVYVAMPAPIGSGAHGLANKTPATFRPRPAGVKVRDHDAQTHVAWREMPGRLTQCPRMHQPHIPTRDLPGLRSARDVAGRQARRLGFGDARAVVAVFGNITAGIAGQPFEIIFENDDMMPHNLVVVQPGAREAIGAITDKMQPTQLTPASWRTRRNER